MTDCTFTLNAGNLWQCTECGWVYKRPSEKPPRRNCPKSDGKPPATPTDRIRSAHAALDPPPIDAAELDRRLAVCAANECGHCSTGVCDERGSKCRRYAAWQERVLFGDCKHWKTP